MNAVTLEPVTTSEARHKLPVSLTGNEIPTSRIDEATGYSVFVCVDDQSEEHDSVGYLHFIVVEGTQRARNDGTHFWLELERCTQKPIDTLYSLTTSAKPFFPKRGYQGDPPGDVPKMIRSTRQFSGLYSDSTPCMRRSISHK